MFCRRCFTILGTCFGLFGCERPMPIAEAGPNSKLCESEAETPILP